MKITLRKFHKYISLIVSVQLLLWTISGIYFSFNKIENVRGEQYRIENKVPSPNQKEQTKMLSTGEAKEGGNGRQAVNQSSFTPDAPFLSLTLPLSLP